MAPGARRLIAALVLAMLQSSSHASCPAIVPGSCWVVDAGTVSVVSAGSAYGQLVRCSLRCRAPGGPVLILRNDGTYSMPANTPAVTCGSGTTVAIPDEEGPIREKRGKLVLEPRDLTPIDALLGTCVGGDVLIRRYRTTLRLDADGTTLSGVSKARFVLAGRVPITNRVIQRFTAARVTADTAVSSSARARDLPPCSAELEPRCVTD